MLTKEQKWMNRLERCLKDMPKGCELLVNLDSHNQSSLSLLVEGEMDNHSYDLICLNIDEEKNKANSFSAKRVIACSENI